MDHNEIKTILLRYGESLKSIDLTLVRQEENLKEHMRRTALLEDRVFILDKAYRNTEGVVKFIMLVGTIATIFLTITKILK